MARSTESLSGVVLCDIGSLVNKYQTNVQTPLLRDNLLFCCSAVELANDKDNKILRDTIGITTIINSRVEKARYLRGDGNPSPYSREICSTVHVLGVTSCRICLRAEMSYIKGRLGEMSPRARSDLEHKSRTAPNINDPKLGKYEWSCIPPRTAIDDNFALLQASAKHIGDIFNNILAAPRAFPLLVSSDRTMQDTSLLIFLILQLLDVPLDVIEHSIREMEQVILSSDVWGVGVIVQGESALQADGHHWVRGLCKRLEAQYGSVAGFFRAARVAEATKKSIRDVLMVQSSLEKNELLIDFECSGKA